MEKVIVMLKWYDWLLMVVILDVDSFKFYNDNYGYFKGDECLKNVVIGFNEVIICNFDFCVWYGGEEFVVILFNIDEKGVKVKVEEIWDVIELLGIEYSKSIVLFVIIVSLGVVMVNFVNYYNWMLILILNIVDKVLYGVKMGGWNCCVFLLLFWVFLYSKKKCVYVNF